MSIELIVHLANRNVNFNRLYRGLTENEFHRNEFHRIIKSNLQRKTAFNWSYAYNSFFFNRNDCRDETA